MQANLIVERNGRKRTAWYEAEGARVKVSSRCRTIKEAEAWLRPKEVPPGSLRQGEFYFVPVPHDEIGDPDKPDGYEQTSQYSWRAERWMHWAYLDAKARHCPEECRVRLVWGETAFIGRKGRIRTHRWEARPRVFVSGSVSHPEHGDLELPQHEGGWWYEVIPNRAHGPWRPGHSRFGGGID